MLETTEMIFTYIWGHYEVLAIRRHEGAEGDVDSAED